MRCLNCGNPSVGDYCSARCAEEDRRVTNKASELLNNALPALPGGYIARSEVEALIESRVSERTQRLREALEFYAKIGSASEARRLFVQDGGATARRALESE